MLKNPLPLGKMHGRKIITGTRIVIAGSILSSGTTSMSRGTILRMTGGTYGLIIVASRSPQIFPLIGMTLCIVFLLEILLRQFSLVIGCAKYLLHQLRLIVVFVSQQFFVSSPEFTQHFAEHDERHFADEGEDSSLNIRYNGSEAPKSDVRYYGSIEEQPKVRHYGHMYLNHESNVQHTLLTDYVVCQQIQPMLSLVPDVLEQWVQDLQLIGW